MINAKIGVTHYVYLFNNLMSTNILGTSHSLDNIALLFSVFPLVQVLTVAIDQRIAALLATATPDTATCVAIDL